MLDFPATHRNSGVIGDVLAEIFSPEKQQDLLEIASGSGQHAVTWAQRFPKWRYQASDLEQEHVQSIKAYREYHALSNMLEPKVLDVNSKDWGLLDKFDGILAINLIHISPWHTTQSLFRAASSCLKPDGKLFLYGAYRVNGEHTSESNRSFDQSLRAQNASWGVRCLNDVVELASSEGFRLERTEPMPANNLSVIFGRHED